jgi:phosphoserine phosphatase RsbU/P
MVRLPEWKKPRAWPGWARALRLFAALALASCTLLYTGLWMAAVRASKPPAVELGYDDAYRPSDHSVMVRNVIPNSPAQRAGMRAGDRIVRVNGAPIEDAGFVARIWKQHQPGDAVQLTIERPGSAAPVVLTGTFRRRITGRLSEGWAGQFAEQLHDAYPLPFVAVGLAVLFLRLEDPKAWLLALLFAAFGSIEGSDTGAIAPALQPFARAYQATFVSMLGPLFYWFFAVFPAPSPVERRLPWLKWLAVAAGASVAIPGIGSGTMRLPPLLIRALGEGASDRITLWFALGFLALGLVSLAWNYRRAADRDARRKIRVIVWGTAAGLVPKMAEAAARNTIGFQSPDWLTAALTCVAFLIPLSFAYAVLKHRVLEIPVLLKRSVRYILVQRGFTVAFTLASIALTLLFAASFARQSPIAITQTSGIMLGAVFGTVLLWTGSQVHKRVSGSIDRVFFRRAYDARMILEDLAEKSLAATDRAGLALLLERNVRKALEPSFLAIYLQEQEGRLTAHSGAVDPALRTVPEDLPLLVELARAGRPCEWSPELAGFDGAQYAFADLRPDCLAPVLGRDGRLTGLLALGPRLSEEPYSGEDKRLLGAVATQAGMALENIRLAGEIAERMETERRAAREMEIAKEVQARLLPEAPPRLETVEFAARCIQAKSVGGDCFDFLDIGEGRTAFVLADVSGKGMHAALLMANLQAHLRSQSGIAPFDPARMLQRVNHMLWKSTAAQHYATLFFGIYEDAARRLAYINCGHNPPFWLRHDGTVAQLDASATVIGLFERWECAVREIQLAPGDMLAVYSDGVTEAAFEGAEFGEERLIAELRRNSRKPVEEIVAGVLSAVERFSPGAQSDDLTLLLARVR